MNEEIGTSLIGKTVAFRCDKGLVRNIVVDEFFEDRVYGLDSDGKDWAITDETNILQVF